MEAEIETVAERRENEKPVLLNSIIWGLRKQEKQELGFTKESGFIRLRLALRFGTSFSVFPQGFPPGHGASSPVLGLKHGLAPHSWVCQTGAAGHCCSDSGNDTFQRTLWTLRIILSKYPDLYVRKVKREAILVLSYPTKGWFLRRLHCNCVSSA